LSLKFFTKRFPLLLLIACACLNAYGQSGRVNAPPAPSPVQSAPPVVKPGSNPITSTPPGIKAPLAAQTPVAQPSQVITIIHRLSGWKLRAWLAFTDAKILEPSLVNQFVYTNIVAGYVLGDGRSVVARLPEADAEMLSLPDEIGFNGPKPVEGADALTLVRRDGARLNARFIGLDGSTWLTLLEADGLQLPTSRDAAEEGIKVGQPVKLFAPLRAPKAETPTVGAINNASAVFMRIGEIKGTIADIARSSTGRVTRLTVRAEGLSPQVIGGVVLNDAGETVGMVETSNGGEARVIPSSIVKRAAERVLQRRASVPRPLLGVRGEAISATTLKKLETIGWKLEEANKLLTEQQGLLLTMVAPNSPAALADLRKGDIIVRVNNGEVKNSEDFSYLINEAGGGASVRFTVLRAEETEPREVTIKLSEALNLRRATEMETSLAQRYAALADMAALPVTPAANTATTQAPNTVKPNTTSAMTAAARDSSLMADLDWIILPAEKQKARRNASSLLLINLVRPGSQAEKLGLRSGDMVVTVNRQKLAQNEWTEKFLLLKATDLTIEVMRGRQRITLKYNEK
jgi:S1-C subfamily serine protease